MIHSLGLIPSPPSNKDYEAEKLLGAGSPPDQFQGLSPFVSIHNQNPTSTCVLQSISQAIRTFLKYRDPSIPDDFWPSVLFGYFNTLKKQGRGIVDKGCIPRIALSTLTNAGFCDEVDWPFDVSKVLDQPLPNAYTQAYDQRLITSYYRIFSVGDELVQAIKLALSKGHPVIYGSPIDMGYNDYKGGILGPPTGPWIGSHMRCLVGYTPDYAIESNSWGQNWGEAGFAKISWDFIKFPWAHDFWVFDGAPRPTG